MRFHDPKQWFLGKDRLELKALGEERPSSSERERQFKSLRDLRCGEVRRRHFRSQL